MQSRIGDHADTHHLIDPVGEELIALQETVHPQRLSVGRTLSLLGRHPSCHLVVQLSVVSRFHAHIERHDNHCILSDTGSTNGTFVNGERLTEPHILASDDQIGLGASLPMLRFCDTIHTTDPAASEHSLHEEWLVYDPRTMQFYLHGHAVNLSMQQFRLLLYLYNNQGTICTREECATIIGGAGYTLASYTGLDEAFNKLRKKLCQALPDADEQMAEAIRKKLIVTKPGRGYILHRHVLVSNT